MLNPDTTPCARQTADRFGLHPGEMIAIPVLLIFLGIGLQYTITQWNRLKSQIEAVTLALADPAFIEAASNAGYRLERSGTRYEPLVLARCARSDRSGPTACDPFPPGPYRSIPGDGNAPVTVLP